MKTILSIIATLGVVSTFPLNLAAQSEEKELPLHTIPRTNAAGVQLSPVNTDFASCGTIPALLPERDRPVNLSETLQFLRSIPELKDLTLFIRPNELESSGETNGLYLKKTVSKKDVTYWLLTPQGENVVVMFGDDGDCRGVQRLSPIPTKIISQTIGEIEYRTWMDKLQKRKQATIVAPKP